MLTLFITSISKQHKMQFECLVCFDGIKCPIATPCGHMFCENCITTWLLDHAGCPTCRRDVSTGSVLKIYSGCGSSMEILGDEVEILRETVKLVTRLQRDNLRLRMKVKSFRAISRIVKKKPTSLIRMQR